MGYYTGAGSKISTLAVDADLDMGAYDLKSDDIKESTAAAGVDVDGVGMKDAEVCSGVLAAAAFPKAASANLRDSNDAIANVTPSPEPYHVMKTFTFPKGFKGTLRCAWKVTTNSDAGGVYIKTKIYKNGVAIGTEQTETDTGTVDVYQPETEDIDLGVVAPGGTVELWGYTNSGIADKCHVKEFRLSYDNAADLVALGAAAS